jgi:hypothetical protein
MTLRFRPAQPSVVALSVIVACATPPPAAPATTAAAIPSDTRPTTSSSSPPRVAWLADLDALEHHLGRHYANLEWNDAVRKLDLAALDRSARTALIAARTDVEATEALARFVSAFRDAHLNWSTPLPSTDYDVRFTSDGTRVAVRVAGPNPCGLAPGDEIDTIEGQPALEQLARRLSLGGVVNEALRRDAALRTFTGSPFAPRERLDFTVRRGGGSVRCTLVPRTAAPRRELPAPTPATTGEDACAAFGVVPGAPPTLPFLFHTEHHADLRPHAPAQSDLGSGILRLAAGRSLGWLRIPLFSAAAYPVACSRAWTQFRARIDRACDDACRGEFLDRFLPRFLVETIAVRLEAFRSAGVSAVVVDVTDNGGGDDWVDDVLRMMSAGPLLCPATAFVREPSAVERLDRELADQNKCDALPLDAPAGRALTAMKAWTQMVRADAAQSCDLGGLFRGEPPSPTCSLLTRKRRASCDRSPAPAGVTKLPDGCTVFQPPGSSASGRGLVHGPVYVLINRRTGSAAEAFAAILRDNHAATLVGEPTVGAGCGYVDGGSPIVLAQSGMTVRLPNCARYRADGSNEVEGVNPDVLVPWAIDDLKQFDSYAEKILASAATLFTSQKSPGAARRK